MFYLSNFYRYLIPDPLFRSLFLRRLNRLSEQEKAVIRKRVDYYVRLEEEAQIDPLAATYVKDFKYPFRKKHKFSAYFLDLYDSVRCFPRDWQFHYLFGDVDYETSLPTFVKSRPIVRSEAHSNSVVCRLNKFRHFRFVDDPKPWANKQDRIVFRNIVKKQPQRTRLLELYHQHPLCDVGQINPDDHPEFVKPYLTIGQILEYKFVACIEGHDVATNLKWVMSSNSLAVMPKPKMESWFMEGTLVGGYHYVEIKDDYSDLIEKLQYYLAHPQEAEAIIRHAHDYVNQFRNETLERCTQYEVVKRYFSQTRAQDESSSI